MGDVFRYDGRETVTIPLERFDELRETVTEYADIICDLRNQLKELKEKSKQFVDEIGK